MRREQILAIPEMAGSLSASFVRVQVEYISIREYQDKGEEWYVSVGIVRGRCSWKVEWGKNWAKDWRLTGLR